MTILSKENIIAGYKKLEKKGEYDRRDISAMLCQELLTDIAQSKVAYLESVHFIFDICQQYVNSTHPAHTLEKIADAVQLAEDWCADQGNEMTDGSICISALKDIRRHVRTAQNDK